MVSVKEKITKKITFCRRNKNAGVYTGNVKVKNRDQIIRLVDRAVLTPTDPETIKFLHNDPEIEVLCSDEEEQKVENERNAEKD